MLTAGKPGYSSAASGIQIDIYKCSGKQFVSVYQEPQRCLYLLA